MEKFDIDLSLNPIKPKNLKQYAQMKIEERRKKQQIERGEPIDVLHGNPAVVRGYKDLNIKRDYDDSNDNSAYSQYEMNNNQIENALSNARYMRDNGVRGLYNSNKKK